MDLDAILDSALDDFDSSDPTPLPPQPTPAPTAPVTDAPPTYSPPTDAANDASKQVPPDMGFPFNANDFEGKEFDEFKGFLDQLTASNDGKQILESLGVEDEKLEGLAKDFFDQLAKAGGQQQGPVPASGTAAAAPSANAATKTGSQPAAGGDFNSAIDEAIRSISQNTAATDQGAAPDLNSLFGNMNMGGMDGNDDMLSNLMSSLASEGGEGQEGGFDKMVEGLMSQMLSKDVLYPPIKDITNKFPKYLEENKDSLDDAKFKEYEKQYECFQRICVAFEETPENTKEIMDLMQEMQNYGQPPKEMLDGILPPGMMPTPDGSQAPPGLPGMDENFDEAAFMKSLEQNPECSIM